MEQVKSFDTKLRQYKGAPGHTNKTMFNTAVKIDSSVGVMGDVNVPGGCKSRLEVTTNNLTIKGKTLEDKLLREEDVWVLQNAMCSHIWKLPTPHLDLSWIAYCERQESVVGSKKSIIQRTIQLLPLAGAPRTRVKLLLRSPEIRPKVGLVVDSISGREVGTM